MPHRWAHSSVAAYVLGIDAGGTRAVFRAHLMQCEPCRAEWLQLREVPLLLARATAALGPSPGLDTAAWERIRGHRVERR